MNDPLILSKYLAGNASDEEAQRCEKLLQDSTKLEELIGDLDGSPVGDSLVETLRNLGNHSTKYDLEDPSPKSLVEQIQSLVANTPIGQDDFDRVLSPAESSDEIGRIARYRVIEFIASGGMGLVFKAEDSKLNRLVCIKVLNPSLANNNDSVARFAREAQAAAKLRNTRITTVLEFGQHKELPFLVMELLEGQSLRDKINVEGKLAPATARKFTTQIAEGLRYAHQRGYLHRDIKPENIWVTPEGDIKLLDFGLARAFEETTNLTHSGTILGTPTYMSPEQVRGKELDVRSDLFSVGTVLFEMLTGESPFGKSNLFSTMMSVANDTLAFPESTGPNAIPDELKPIVQSLLQKSPEHRLASAEDLIVALNGNDGTVPSLKTGANSSGMNRGVVGLLGGIAGACFLALAFLLYQFNDKGTLVVEADPSVNVNLAGEIVSIEDPQTGKKFKVTIGDHPLPSGVYQLQMTDESGQYTLSSEVISIRRGEQQIVRVELKPASAPSAEAMVNNEPNPKESDPTDKPAVSLASLPTLDAAELRRKLVIQPGDQLFRNALVTEPSNRLGVTSWSIEPAFNEAANVRINSDGELIATISRYDENMVSIRNRDSQLTHIIPAQDKIREIKWSPDPNIIAVLENGDQRKQVTVWKLLDGHVEAIDVIPGSGLHVAWSSDGLLLSVQNEREISFIDLSKGSVFAHPNFGIQGKMSDRPWSRDGRYFATAVEEGVKIWDLEERKLLHIFVGKTEGQFLLDENQVAVKEANQWEIWDLDSFVRLRTIKSEPGWFRYWPNPQFQKLAIVTDEGELLVKDVETGETALCDFELDPLPTTANANTLKEFYELKQLAAGESRLVRQHLDIIDVLDPRTKTKEKQLLLQLRSMKLNWAPSGLDFVTGGSVIYVSNADRAQGNKAIELAELQAMNSFARPLVPFGRQGIKLPFEISHDGKRLVYDDKLLFLPPGSISSFDFAGMNAPSSEVSIRDDAYYRASPDGKMIAMTGPDADNKVTLAEYSKVRLYSTETGKLIKTLENGVVNEMLWSPDSNSLIVSSAKLTATEKEEFKKYRLKADKLIEEFDADGDETLDKSEAERMRESRRWKKLFDESRFWKTVAWSSFSGKDEDGFLTKEQIAKALWKGIGGSNFYALETRIINIESGDEILLEANDGDTTEEEGRLCFEKDQSTTRFVNPVLLGRQIVLPLFDASTFRNGYRAVPGNVRDLVDDPASRERSRTQRERDARYKIRQRTNEAVVLEDKLGFFDLKTGKLNELVELNCEFGGRQFSVTEQMISISTSARHPPKRPKSQL